MTNIFNARFVYDEGSNTFYAKCWCDNKRVTVKELCDYTQTLPYYQLCDSGIDYPLRYIGVCQTDIEKHTTNYKIIGVYDEKYLLISIDTSEFRTHGYVEFYFKSASE